MKAAASRVGQVVHRGLTYALPGPDGCRMVLGEPQGLTLRELECERSFRRIQTGGTWWRLAGRDRESGELVYLPEPEDAA